MRDATAFLKNMKIIRHHDDDDDQDLYVKGDVILGGLFPVHEKSETETEVCSRHNCHCRNSCNCLDSQFKRFFFEPLPPLPPPGMRQEAL